MTIRTISAFLALVATISPGCSNHVSLWGEGVFPDDLSWLSSYNTRRFANATANEVDTKGYKVCETLECKKVADEFLSSMNKSVDPCDDFYEFACGGWSAKDPIPPSKAAWSRFMIFQNTVQRRIKEVLETKVDPSDILPLRQAKKWYRSCMDIEILERRGVKPIESILLQAGGWPIAMDEDEWDSEVYTWQKVERHYARLTGGYTLYSMEVPHSPFRDSGHSVLKVGPPEVPLSEHLPLKYRNYSGSDYELYLRLVEGTAKLFVRHNRADVSEERMNKEAREVVEFEKEIYNLKQGHEYGSMTLAKFVEWYDEYMKCNMTKVNSDPKAKIDWRSVIQGLFYMVNVKVNTSMEILSNNLGYIKGIGEILHRTPARTIVNYIHWNFVAKMLPYTTEGARNDLFKLVNEEYGVKERGPRWVECVTDVKMSDATAYVFVDKYFTKSTESASREMIKNIQNGMEEQIEKSNWLNGESKKWAKEKLNGMKMLIGFPDWYKNKTAVINRYKGLTIGSEYFDNTLGYVRYEAKRKLKRITGSKRRAEDIWSYIDPVTVNAIYGGDINTLSIPAADFQTPLFTPQFPNNVNYATAGIIVGHEMGHGFDDNGIQYGKDRNATLSMDVLMNYYQNAECFLDQYGGYFEDNFGTKSPETGVSRARILARRLGMQTMGENIADTTGIQSVFEAYKRVRERASSGETRLPGLEEYTDDQLFFVSFGAMWCQVQRPEYEKKKKEARDVHSPPKFRVIGAVSNTKDFARAFDCPAGSPMNPRDKCCIWEKPGATIAAKHGGGSARRNNHRWDGQWKS